MGRFRSLMERAAALFAGGKGEEAERLVEAELSHSDIRALLGAALKARYPGRRTWVRDTFPDTVVWDDDGMRGEDAAPTKMYRAPYTMTDQGAVTLGDPVEVKPVTTYEPVQPQAIVVGTPAAEATSGAGAEEAILGEILPLVESAVAADGTVLLKMIKPGWGESGYYSAQMLAREAPIAFPTGTQSFWNHPTPDEEAERPEGDLRNLASVTVEPARYLESGPKGPGVYARADVRPEYREAIDWLAPHIGTSIKVPRGVARLGEAEGRKGKIVEKLLPSKLNTVDYVTRAGAGGEIVQLFEAARGGGRLPRSVPVSEAATPGAASPPVSSEGEVQMDKKEVEALIESATAGLKSELATLRESDQKKNDRIQTLETDNARLRDAALLREAGFKAAQALKDSELPESAVRRVLQKVTAPKAIPVKDGVLDTATLLASVQEAAKEELKYLQEAAGFGSGQIKGMGSGSPDGGELSSELVEKKLAESFGRMGLPEKEAASAAHGRFGWAGALVLALLCSLLAWPAAAETNRVYSPGYKLWVACSSPSAPDSGDPVRYGKLTGVAQTDEDLDGNTSVDFGPGVWDVYVYDEGGAGIAVGDPIYYDDTAAGTPSVNLTNSSTGAEAFFGVAMEVVSAGATTEIQVRHIEVGLMSTLASNAVVSATITDGTIVTADVAENGIAADNLAANVQNVILCGENAENGTTYFGPATAPFGGDGSASYAIGSAGCDALDNTTEGTADAPLTTGMPAFKVLGFYCKTDGTLGAGETIVFTLRSAAADTTPVLSCTISEAGSTCSEADGSTTDIAAGATLAMKAVETSNNSDDNAWCNVAIAVK